MTRKRHGLAVFTGDEIQMRIPTSVLVVVITGLLLLALAAGSWRARAEPNLAAPNPVAPATEDCFGRLVKAGAAVERVAVKPGPAGGACDIADPARLLSIADPALPGRRIAFPDKPLLSCAMAERFARFAADIAAPLALGIYGKELASAATGPGHECRPRNRQAGAKMSSHGQGLAVDIMYLELHGGMKVSVEKPDGPLAVRLIDGLRAAACGAFSTVLGPGSDAAHATHLHFDIEPRGRDGKSKFCQ
jgi:hypothetical protein